MLENIKEKIKHTKFYSNHIKKYHIFIRIHLRYLLLYGVINPSSFHIIRKKKVIYLKNSKVACSSIISSLYSFTLSDNDNYLHIHREFNGNLVLTPNNIPSDCKAYYKFTYVRNPFTRLVSCYKNKFENNVANSKVYHNYLLGYLSRVESFDNFIKKVCKIPFPFSDNHFLLQYNLIYDKKGKCLIDYVGNFEDLPNDYNEKIADVYGFSHLPHYNKTESSKRWEDYYTIETANLVYKKYRKDFEAFGYEDSYNGLIDYLNKKAVAPDNLRA